jgi:hypothetical protein
MDEVQSPDDVDIPRLARELGAAEPVRAELPAFEAFSLLGALQFAWRNPGLSELHRSIVEKAARDLQEALARRSAYVGQVAELGWQREHDVHIPCTCPFPRDLCPWPPKCEGGTGCPACRAATENT